MTRTIGVMAFEHIAVGLVEDNRLVGAKLVFPDTESEYDSLGEMPGQEIAQGIARQVQAAADGGEVAAIGVGFPGIIRANVVEDSPNLQQMKGQRLGERLSALLSEKGIRAPVFVINDADAIAAGLAATRGQLASFIRVWALGSGIGFGRYPQAPGAWENGHTIVSLDPKETFCRCGGAGHLEGVMGRRAMRLRFLDLEPEEVFAQAQEGDERCVEFVKLWHRALAAATADSVHADGPGKFFVTGPSARFVQSNLLDAYLHEMVKMSPLQGSSFEIVPSSDETAIIGAGVSAAHSAAGT
ncbi:MAG: glucokinase [Acidobacteriota bacterium]|jgi:predicted NBD/HSP70 family sugar kinase|nr:glucokinase [Acidobacteriota bacterium]MDT7780061.1 glucokinase [Acidobacteriota bacterium]